MDPHEFDIAFRKIEALAGLSGKLDQFTTELMQGAVLVSKDWKHTDEAENKRRQRLLSGLAHRQRRALGQLYVERVEEGKKQSERN